MLILYNMMMRTMHDSARPAVRYGVGASIS